MYRGPEHFSLPENFNPVEISRVRTEIQRAIILDLINPDSDQDDKNSVVMEWIEKYAYTDIYSVVFNKYLGQNPMLIKDWEDLSKREKIISDIKKDLAKSDLEQKVDAEGQMISGEDADHTIAA